MNSLPQQSAGHRRATGSSSVCHDQHRWWPVQHAAAASLSSEAVFKHIPHDRQLSGWGLQDAVRHLRRQGQQHVAYAALHMGSAATSAASWGPANSIYQKQQQHQQLTATSLLPKPLKGLSASLQQQQHLTPASSKEQQPRQQQQQPVLPDSAQGTFSNLQQQQQQLFSQQRQRQEGLRQAISNATTYQQLQQLVPQVAALGLPDLITVLLLQAVSVRKSSGSSNSTGGGGGGAWQLLSVPADVGVNQQQRQQQQQQLDEELHQLLLACDVALDRQVHCLQFQHVSGILWAWSQFGWRPVEGSRPSGGVGLNMLLQRLLRCPVEREMAGKAPNVGPQLSRVTVACAQLGTKDPRIWDKLHRMIQGLAPVLSPMDVSRCAWGLARSRFAPRAHARPIFKALLARAQSLTASKFDRVKALNLLWAVVDAGVWDLAPAGLTRDLLGQILGHSYQAWLQQDGASGPAAATKETDRGPSDSSNARDSPAACSSYSPHDTDQVSAGAISAPSSNGDTARAVGDIAVTSGLTPAELSCLVWTLFSVKQQHQQLQGVQRSQRHSLQQQQHQQQQQLQLDQHLLGYLSSAVVDQLQQLHPRQISQLAQGFAALAEPCPDLLPLPAEPQVVVKLWERALQLAPEGQLATFNLIEVSLLLQSVALLAKLLLQQQQQQQHEQPQQSAAVRTQQSIVTAAIQRILSAHPRELPPRTAAVLLHQLGKLHRYSSTATAGVGAAAAAGARDGMAAPAAVLEVLLPAAGAAAVLRLSKIICSPGAISQLRDHELVLAATAAGELAAASWSTASATSSSPHSSTSSSGSSSCSWHLQQLLEQLALPLAAICPSLKLRSLANVACAYAAWDLPAPDLFDAVAQAAQRRRVLDRGSSWALARMLAAFATVSYVDEGLFAAVSEAMMPRLAANTLQARVLAKFAWALAASGWHDAALFKQISAVIAHSWKSLISSTPDDAAGLTAPEDSSSSSRGMSGAGHQNSLLHYLAPRDIASLAWALGTVGLKDPVPYQALAEAGLQKLPGLDAGQLANLLWGLAGGGVYHEGLVAAVSMHLVGAQQQDQQDQQEQRQQKGLLAAATAEDVATLAWSLSELRALQPSVLVACMQHFLDKCQQYSPSDAADLAWALTWYGPTSLPLVAFQQQQPQKDQPSASSGGGLPASQGHSRSGSTSETVGSTASYLSSEVGSIRDVPLQHLLQQLLPVVEADLDQLNPQQLVNTCLVTAALEAHILPAAYHSSTAPAAAGTGVPGTPDGCAAGHKQEEEEKIQGLRGSSSGSISRLQQSLWASTTAWGRSSWTAADAAKLFMARLLAAGQQQPPQLGSAAVSAVHAKLLSAGARAVVRHTAAVCSTHFCQQVVSTLKALNLQAYPTLPSPTSTAAVAAVAEAAAAAAAACTAATLPGHIWASLGPEVAAQLIAHVVVTLPSSSGRSVQEEQFGSVQGNTAVDANQQQQQRQQSLQMGLPVGGRHVLLQLVPAGEASRTTDMPDALATTIAQERPQQRLVWRAAVAASLLLQQQRHSVGVVLTQQQWEQWGEQQQQQQQLMQLLLQH